MNGNTVRFSLHESARLGHLPGLFNPHLQKWLHLDLQPLVRAAAPLSQERTEFFCAVGDFAAQP
jgi:hypothetical protein